MRHSELLRQRLAARIQVDADNFVGAHQLRTLNDIEADPAETKHHHVGAGLDLGRVDDGADAGRDAAADVADLVERRVLADFGHRDLRQHREVGEGRTAHVVMNHLLADGEAAGTIRHHALALGGANRRA